MKTANVFHNNSLCMQLNCSNLTEGKNLAKQLLATKGFSTGSWKKLNSKAYLLKTSNGQYRLEIK